MGRRLQGIEGTGDRGGPGQREQQRQGRVATATTSDPRHERGYLGDELAREKTRRADAPGENAARFAMEPHAPGCGDPWRRASGEQAGDDSGEDVARSTGGEARAAA